MDYAGLAALITAAGGGAIIPQLVKRAYGALTGRGRQRRDEVDRAWRRVDREAQKRRIAEEHSSQLRRMLHEAPCVPTDSIPPYPLYPVYEPETSTTTTRTQKEK